MQAERRRHFATGTESSNKMHTMFKSFGLRGSYEYDGFGILAAIENGNLANVEFLLDKYGDQLPYGSCLLLCAALKFNHEDIAKFMLSRGAEVNPNRDDEMFGLRISEGTPYTPLHYAVHVRDEQIMETLLEKGALINAKAGCRNSTPLFEAVFYKKAGMVEILLRHGADVNIPEYRRETPIQCAAERGLPMTKMLLEHGADPNSALHQAAKGGKLAIVKLLLSYGASVDSKSHDDSTPLRMAVEYRHGKLVEYLLQRGADVDALDISNNTILHNAVETGDPVIVNIVLSHRPRVNNDRNQYAVHIALRNLIATKQGHVYGEILENLLSYGFNIAEEDANNPQVLYFALRNAYEKTVAELLNRGSNFKVVRNSILSDIVPLYPTTLSNKGKLAKVLVKYSATENTLCTLGLGPRKWSVLRNMDLSMFELLLTDKGRAKNSPQLLKFAVWHGHLEIVECLLWHGIDVNAHDSCGRTALHFCVLRRKNALCPSLHRSRTVMKVDTEIVKLLLLHGADVNATTVIGETPLHLAAQNKLFEIVEVLLSSGQADLNATDGQDRAALHHFTHQGNLEMSESLLLKGADVNVRGRAGLTPLHVASEDGHRTMVQLLLEYGADIDMKSKSGTPLHVASLAGHPSIVQYLVESGADVNITTADNRAPFDNTVNTAANTVGGRSAQAACRYYLLCHLIKMKVANMFLIEKNLNYSVSFSDEEVQNVWLGLTTRRLFSPSSYETECEEEVAALKNYTIEDSNSTFFDVLVESEERVMKLSANENLEQIVNSEDFETRFPNYTSWIRRKVEKAVWLRELREECGRVLVYVHPNLPLLCIDQIMKYLTVSELRALAHVSKFLD